MADTGEAPRVALTPAVGDDASAAAHAAAAAAAAAAGGKPTAVSSWDNYPPAELAGQAVPAAPADGLAAEAVDADVTQQTDEEAAAVMATAEADASVAEAPTAGEAAVGAPPTDEEVAAVMATAEAEAGSPAPEEVTAEATADAADALPPTEEEMAAAMAASEADADADADALVAETEAPAAQEATADAARVPPPTEEEMAAAMAAAEADADALVAETEAPGAEEATADAAGAPPPTEEEMAAAMAAAEPDAGPAVEAWDVPPLSAEEQAALAAASAAAPPAAAEAPSGGGSLMGVMSFNIRFDNPNEAPEDQWDARKVACAQIVLKYRPALLGLQEPHRHQVEQMAAMLPGYSWFGKGRHLAFMGLNEEHNELNPVFFDAGALSLEASGQWWYSDTPEIPNTKWACSAFPRIATWGRFLVNGTRRRLCFINTHFDHENEEARTLAAEMLLRKLPDVSLGLPTVVVGDLNTGEGSPALAMLCSALYEASSTCACSIIPGMLGVTGTYVGFDKAINSHIDFIFASQARGLTYQPLGAMPTGYGTIPDERPNGRCCSDHRPIMANITVPDCPFSDAELAARASAAAQTSAAGAAAAIAADKTRFAAGVVADRASEYASVAAVEGKKAAVVVAGKASEYASVAAVEGKKAAAVVADKASEYASVAAVEGKKAAAVVADKAQVAAAQAADTAKKAAEQLGSKLKSLFG